MQAELDGLERQLKLLECQCLDSTLERGVLMRPNDAWSLRRRYILLSREATALYAERKRLMTILDEKQLHEDSLRPLLEELKTTPPSQNQTIRYSHFTPWSLNKCLAFIRNTMSEMSSFTMTLDQHCITSGSSFMGWSDRRRVDPQTGEIQFTFTKRFYFGSNIKNEMQRLVSCSWKLFCDQTLMYKVIFRSHSHLELETLQHVHDGIVILRRLHRYKAIEFLSFHTIYLLFWVPTERGYTLCFRTIPSPQAKAALEERETWIELFHWVHFHELENDECEVVFGGSIGIGDAPLALNWMLELITAIVRWEHSCVVPMVLTNQE